MRQTWGAWAAAAALAVALALPLASLDPSVLNIAVFTLMYVGLATAWNIIGGFAGYISLGHAGFFGIGAYALGLLVGHLGVPGGYGPFLLVPVAGLLTAAVAVPVGWIALRTRAATFVIVTIAFMFMLQILATNLRGLTGGSQGLGYPAPEGWSPRFVDVPFYYAMLGLAAVAVLAAWWIRGSKLGLGLRAAGHKVRLATHADFAPLARERGLDFFPLTGSSQRLHASAAGAEMIGPWPWASPPGPSR